MMDAFHPSKSYEDDVHCLDCGDGVMCVYTFMSKLIDCPLAITECQLSLSRLWKQHYKNAANTPLKFPNELVVAARS